MGPGGVGKTRLAIQAAADLIARYPDGVYFVPLAQVDSSSDIAQAVAESLGLGLSTDDDPLQQLLAYLSNKAQLLILDNFEHLSGGAAIVGEVLTSTPHVTVVVTSRSRLNVSGETVLSLSGLETEWTSPESAAQASGVRLFIDAARRIDPGFDLEEHDLEPMRQILRLTGGIPLGILLAAAWTDILTVDEIAEELSRSIDFLETEMADLPERHKSVRAVFDYSWRHLSDDERSVFRALSVFRGGFDRRAAQAVAGASLRDLQRLAGKSLVSPTGTAGRYFVHELLRQYGERKLEEDARRSRRIRDAHTEFFAALAGDAFELFTSADQPLLLATIEQDLDNIRLAWRSCAATGNVGGLRRLALGLWIPYEFRGWYPSAVALFDEALPSADRFDRSQAGEAAALAAAVQSWFLTLVGRLELADARSREAVDGLREGRDLEALWFALQSRALCLAYLGEADEMISVTEEALGVGEALGDPFWPAAMKTWRSFAAVLAGDSETPVIDIGSAEVRPVQDFADIMRRVTAGDVR